MKKKRLTSKVLIVGFILLISMSVNVLGNEGLIKSASFELLKPERNTFLQYEDEYIKISFSFVSSTFIAHNKISFNLENRTNRQITVDWNKVSVQLPSGESSEVIHEGIRFINAGSNMSPTTIPPKGRIEDLVAPTENIYETTVWSFDIAKGSTIGLYLPLEVGQEIKNYNFKFIVKEVTREDTTEDENSNKETQSGADQSKNSSGGLGFWGWWMGVLVTLGLIGFIGQLFTSTT